MTPVLVHAESGGHTPSMLHCHCISSSDLHCYTHQVLVAEAACSSAATENSTMVLVLLAALN